MQSNFQEILLQRLFQGDHAWAQAVYLAGMFAVVLWRKESVVNWRLFRLSYLLYGASLVLPPIVAPLIPLVIQGGGVTGNGQIFTYIVSNAMGPTLFAAAVVCGLGSMLPRLMIAHNVPPPQKHPLD